MGVRSGQGFGAAKPKRQLCPECGKRGVTGWVASADGLCRHCQFCQASWGEAGWKLAKELSAQAPAAPKAPRTLTLALNGVYFDQIAAGTKVEEFRLVTKFWTKRLVGRVYDRLVITRGYPSASDTSKRLAFHWNGFEQRMLQHPHFGAEPVEVFAISLAKPISPIATGTRPVPEGASV